MDALERMAVSNDWITLVLVTAFILLVAAKYAFPHRFADFSMLFATDKYLVIQGKEPKIFHPFNILLFCVNTISVGLYIYLMFQTLTTTEIDNPKILYIRIATAYATFVLLKFSLEKIMANVLSIDRLIDYYLFYKLSYRNFMAMILLPVTIIFLYIWDATPTALYIFLGIILLMNVISLLGVFRKNQQYILNNWFYFILYLCALEIGPYFILYKLVTR